MPRPLHLLAITCALIEATGCGFDDGRDDYPHCPPHALCGGPSARIEATPQVVHLEPGNPYTTTTSTTILENVGLGPLELRSIRLEEDTEDDLDELTPEGYWPAEITLEPGDTLSLTVRWTPMNDVRDTGTIWISSNDATARTFEIPITTPAP